MIPTNTETRLPKRSRKRKKIAFDIGIAIGTFLVGIAGGTIAGRMLAPKVPIIQIANQATGDWTKLDLSKYPRVSLFCGTPVGGYACSVNRVQPDMDKDAGTGILLVPYTAEAVPDPPPAGSGHAPDSQKQREHSDSFSTRNLRASR